MTGCLAERYPEEIRSDLAEVDAILGTNQIVRDRPRSGGREPRSRPPPSGAATPTSTSTTIDAAFPGHSRLLRLHEDRRRMRPHLRLLHHPEDPRADSAAGRIPSIVQEARKPGGSRECGRSPWSLRTRPATATDLGLQDGLASLLEALDRVRGLRWIRFLYVYPNLVSDRLMRSSGRRRADVPLHRHAPAARERPGCCAPCGAGEAAAA